MRKKQAARTIACALTLASACALASAFIVLSNLGLRGAHPSPDPKAPDAAAPGRFPAVNWEYWKTVNPDVVGWITIPGTTVNHPIVQARADDPEYYLSHDVYGEMNYTGCPFLDAACENGGGLLRSSNSVVYGHNLGWSQEVFGDLELFSDRAFARSHRDVLLQTPATHVLMKVQAVDVIPGWDMSKRTEFQDSADFANWWTVRFGESDVQLVPQAPKDCNILTLCTCSYQRWASERTLVYCVAE